MNELELLICVVCCSFIALGAVNYEGDKKLRRVYNFLVVVCLGSWMIYAARSSIIVMKFEAL